eukprot:994509-Amphidinium_carterae.1
MAQRSRRSSCRGCGWCGMAAETEFHRIWECPANESLDVQWQAEAVACSQGLLAEAREGMQRGLAAFWLRGLIPACWTRAEARRTEAGHSNVWLQGEAQLDRRATPEWVFVDGSGSCADPRIRVCGWAVVWLNREGAIQGAAQGGVDEQTVPLAELTAL